MRYKFDHDYHIHSYLSLCSQCTEQTPERILQYAKDEKLHTLCMTDHYWERKVYRAPEWYDLQDFEHISKNLPLPQSHAARFLFGCETEMDKDGVIGITEKRLQDFAFICIPTTHLHMGTFVVPVPECDNPTPNGRAQLWEKRFEAVLDKKLPFEKVGIAHLAGTTMNTGSRKDYLETLQSISETEMERLFAKAATLGVGIELNLSDMSFADEEEATVLRMFRIAKYHGCKFYCGTDAHTPRSFHMAREVFERAIDKLSLQESDKFILG